LTQLFYFGEYLVESDSAGTSSIEASSINRSMAPGINRKETRKPRIARGEQAASGGTGKPASPGQNVVLLCVLLSAISAAAYSHSLFNGFINFDDPIYITENTHVRSGLTSETLRWAFTTNAVWQYSTALRGSFSRKRNARLI